VDHVYLAHRARYYRGFTRRFFLARAAGYARKWGGPPDPLSNLGSATVADKDWSRPKLPATNETPGRDRETN